MKRILPLFVLLLSALTAFSQTVTLTFTGRDANNRHLPMNRVVIANATQGWQETIYYPDTVFTMGGTGIADNAANGDFGLRQNNPNPFTGTTYATLQTMNAGEVILEMTDVNGRIVETQNFASLQPGNHQFRINVATAGIYFLTARQNGQASSIKMVNNGQGATNRIEYQDFVNTRNNNNNDNNNVETQNFASLQENNANGNAKGVATHPFSVGDQMEYVGYAIINGAEVESQLIHQQQSASENFTLQFNVTVDGQPCPGTSTVTDHEGNVYNTVQIGNQCWTRENMRCTTSPSTGTTILEASPSSFSYTGKKAYYVNGSSSNTSTYGLLYNWNAAVDTFNTSYGETSTSTSYSDAVSVTFNGNRRGICPTGWHVPSDAEWTQLTTYVKSRPEYVCEGCSGTDDEMYTYCIAKALASTTRWESYNYATCAVGNNPSANNATGFSAVPAGGYNGNYPYFGDSAYFWSATQYNSYNAYYRYLSYNNATVARGNYTENSGFSVRCLRD